jgi:protein-S-isoprenylcysteine O-methyltransferase Ste14
MKIEADSAQVRLPPPLLYVGTLLIGFGIDWLLARSGSAPASGLGLSPDFRLWAGVALGVTGLAVLVSAAGLFRSVGTGLPPWTPTTEIVSGGIYRWTRNPMYVGMTLIFLALAIGLDSIGALLLLPVVMIVMQTQVIAREERYLESKFGEGYLQYKRRVRRWI